MASAKHVDEKENAVNGSQERTYERKPGAAKESGTAFEYKLALLLYLRAQRLTNNFRLGVNSEGAGDFDDIVLEYKHGCKDYRLLIQLKHKDNPESKVQNHALRATKGPFSLNKYFNSVESNLGNGHYDDTHFVLFTNAGLEVPLCIPSVLNPLAGELLNTGGNNGLMYVVKKSDDLCESFRLKGNAGDFINKLIICCCQANVNELDAIIKQELLLHFHRILPNVDSLHERLQEEVTTWWELTGETVYLTEAWPVWQTLTSRSTLLNIINVSLDELDNLLNDLERPKLHLVYPKTDIQLRSLKVLQALQQKVNVTYLMLKLEDIIDSDGEDECFNVSSAVKLWSDGKYDLLVVDIQSDLENEEYIQNSLQMLIPLADENRRLILVSNGELPVELGDDWLCRSDTCTLNQLDEPSRELVLERLWARTPRKTEVLTRDETGELLSIFLLLENGSTTLLADRNGNTPLQLAVAEQNVDKVELLLELGSDTAAADRFGDTSLIIACRHPNSEIVKILLDHGALTTAADVDGDSPLIIAVRKENVDTIRLLLDAKASTTAADKLGNTSLLIAATNGNSEIVDVLLKYGASMRCADLDGNSPLHLAVKSKDARTVRILLQNNARTMAADMDGNTPLLLAVKDGSTEIVKLLLEYNASTTAATMEGDTPLLISVKNRYLEIVKILLDSGASTLVADRHGLTPLQIAEKEHFPEIVEILKARS